MQLSHLSGWKRWRASTEDVGTSLVIMEMQIKITTRLPQAPVRVGWFYFQCILTAPIAKEDLKNPNIGLTILHCWQECKSSSLSGKCFNGFSLRNMYTVNNHTHISK